MKTKLKREQYTETAYGSYLRRRQDAVFGCSLPGDPVTNPSLKALQMLMLLFFGRLNTIRVDLCTAQPLNQGASASLFGRRRTS